MGLKALASLVVQSHCVLSFHTPEHEGWHRYIFFKFDPLSRVDSENCIEQLVLSSCYFRMCFCKIKAIRKHMSFSLDFKNDISEWLPGLQQRLHRAFGHLAS